jgi:hypothetical protein
MTINSPALPRNQLPVDDEKFDSVLSASQVKRLARKGARVFFATIRLVESGSVPPVVASVATLSLDVPTTSVQPISRLDPLVVRCPGFPSCCLSFLKCFRILCRLVCPLSVLKRHSIPTKPGHPPPFWSTYRLSPLEYRELEKQVTKFLKDGILEVS